MDVVSEIKKKLGELVDQKYSIKLPPEKIHVERPSNESFGDFATNISLMLAKETKQASMDIAKVLSYGMSKADMTFKSGDFEGPIFENIDCKEPGFINIGLSKDFLLHGVLDHGLEDDPKKNFNKNGPFRGQKVLFEYTDLNPFKVFHIGHLMSNSIGESLSRIAEFNGAEVKRANYQGDVGMHIAKSIWGIFKKFEKENTSLDFLETLPLSERMKFLGQAYALGATAYKDDKVAQEEIKEINIQVYVAAEKLFSKEKDWVSVADYEKLLPGEPKYKNEDIYDVYRKGRAWSLEDLEVLYDKLGTKFDYYFFESKAGGQGYEIVKKGLGDGVFEEDGGAVIYRGEKHGLHTRVFLNSAGLPVYEAKDLSLPFMKQKLFPYDLSYIVTGNEVNDYFDVILKALEEISPELAKKTTHIGHGMMRFKEGKMSSRTGDVVTGLTLLEDAKLAILNQMELSDSELGEEEKEVVADKLAVGAVKYSVLKHNTSKDITYDKDQAVSVIGDTGPYLQYTYARANSVLEKADKLEDYSMPEDQLEEKEIMLLRHLVHFKQVVSSSAVELSPSIVSGYLFELAQRFNAFYNDVPILNAGSENQKNLRLAITKQLKVVLKTGLWLLGIAVSNKV